ncbi:beta-1,4-glucuronyltransferase 1-like [Drosophila innubila]|uniref:beta-1,4-glucuronyltransferase 1-like n=1 Tax=Drosophila innubila TaxID=198719 RepID=UPI00148CA7C3|nr:beta-1,4-glucuronyltransferase 1-like [Drosophila innubila]XP_034474544.1 beta-1,4-glucuronyltransferase 1-like [Drosophila innubila]XP_034474545.1 beta-1,4-glucuronyltransferase 1-like [Drosophila innubila]
MALQINKRSLRTISLLMLLTLTSLLLLTNLQDARKLTVLSPQQVNEFELEAVDLLGFSKATPLFPQSTEVPRLVTERTRELQKLLKCRNRRLKLEKVQHGDYWVVKNMVIGRESRRMGCAESITYTTNGDYTFFDNLEMIAQRWMGPISFAIHSPGFDLKSTLDAIQYVRNCLPGSQFINDYVSFHVFFSNKHMPEYVPYNEDETLDWPFKCTTENGTLLPPPYVQNRSEMYKEQANMTYPINVGRNIARQAVNTHFIFACDIELFPSLGFVDQFLDMVYLNNSVLSLDNEQPPRVYPLPVFEIFENEQLPNDKFELMKLYHKQRAQLFHARVCANCHKVPRYQDWINRVPNVTDELQLFSMTLRQGSFKYWEPFYVSDNREPFFDERVTWEGQSNKRIQGYAMCLLGYEYHVLHPAFLVHSPGIKKPSLNSKRAIYAKQMTKFIKSKIEPEYRIFYGKNKHCVT